MEVESGFHYNISCSLLILVIKANVDKKQMGLLTPPVSINKRI